MTAPDVCFLGCGAMTARHLDTLRRLRPGARIAVASRDAARARAFAARHGVHESFGSYEQALASSYGVVVVATPPRSHRALLEGAIAAGKHVLVEKPICADLDELAALWPALVASAGVVMVAENDHFAPFQRTLKTQLAALDGGRPLFLDLVRLGVSPPRGWRADRREMPLGALHEGGVHWIRRLMDLASVFEDDAVDHVVDVSAFGPTTPLGDTPHEDTTMLVVRHRSGLTSRLLHSWALPWRLPFDVSKVVLERGALYFDSRGAFGCAFRGRERRWIAPALRDRGGFVAMWRHFLDCVALRRRPELSLAQTFADFAVLDAGLCARRAGRPFSPRRPPCEAV